MFFDIIKEDVQYETSFVIFYVDFVIIAELIAMLTVSIYLMFCTSFVCLVEKMISGNNGLVEAILVHSVESQHL